MVINTLASALPTTTGPSNAAAPCAARPLAECGPGDLVRAGGWLGGGDPAGMADAAGKATGGYASGVVDAVRLPRIRFSAIEGSTVQSTVQHSTMTRLNPVTPGGVGPHPAREPAPA
ncbi:MAG: hypothetical protein ACRDOK_16695 [Streptosporangiaceae bacterium]